MDSCVERVPGIDKKKTKIDQLLALIIHEKNEFVQKKSVEKKGAKEMKN